MEAKIYYNPIYDSLEILIIEKFPDGRRAVALPVKLEMKVIELGAMVTEPTLRLNGGLADSFLKAMANGLDEYGIKTDQDAKLQGTLEATRYHLSDLRKILKIK